MRNVGRAAHGMSLRSGLISHSKKRSFTLWPITKACGFEIASSLTVIIQARDTKLELA
jgi:hypothetical protein